MELARALPKFKSMEYSREGVHRSHLAVNGSKVADASTV